MGNRLDPYTQTVINLWIFVLNIKHKVPKMFCDFQNSKNNCYKCVLLRIARM